MSANYGIITWIHAHLHFQLIAGSASRFDEFVTLKGSGLMAEFHATALRRTRRGEIAALECATTESRMQAQDRLLKDRYRQS